MNILVCVKQVPDTTEIKIDPITRTLIREGVPSIVNTFDAYALEMAVRMKEAYGGKVTVISMGPQQARKALQTCIASGADQAYLLSDKAFGGSDTLATSYILAVSIGAIEKRCNEKFDLIFCGKQAIDGDTGQVGPELAERLDYPQITYVSDISIENGMIKAKRENDEGYDFITATLPAVITTVKTRYDLRLPSIKSIAASLRADIPTLTAAEIEIDKEQCGLNGSPTKVVKTYTPVREKNGIMIKEETAAESAQKLLDMLADAKIM